MRSMIRQNQSSIMFFYDRTTKCQTKSQTSMTIRNCCFSCIEHLKNMRLHLIRDSRTVIFHTYLCFPVCFDSTNTDNRIRCSESAPQTTVANELKENLEAVENFKGSRLEKLAVLYCKQLGINYKNLSDEEFRWLIRILQKSKKTGTPINQRKKR